jgi:RND family efflux transporter MFP subunit
MSAATETRQSPARKPSRGLAALRLALRVVLPLAVLAGAGLVALYLMETAPRAERTPKPRQARLVEVVEVAPARHTVNVEAWGTVKPAKEVTLRAQVSGAVVEVTDKLVPGGRLAAGEHILSIDDADYRLVLQQRESELAKAKSDLAVEQGNQEIARREFELLGQKVTERERQLVLRQPQLDTVKADIASAEAAVAEARLSLQRTRVVAPFDALVISKSVDPGARLTSTQSEIAHLIGTGRYWVEVALPTSELKWIRLPESDGRPGSSVRLHDDAAWPAGAYRQGKVIRLLGDLSSAGRMARLLVAVDDPLALRPESAGQPTLLIGAYLRAEIEGRTIDDAISLDRRHLRAGDTVWLMDGENRLEMRQVEVAHRALDEVLITGGLGPGDRIVTTDIAAPAEGMPLRLAGGDAARGRRQ